MGDQLGLFAGNSIQAPQPELRGLTLWQPWCGAITHAGKRIENRPWAPWASIIGRDIAIHAAAKVDAAAEAEAAQWIRAHVGALLPPAATAVRGAIVAVARVEGYVTRSSDPWFFGPYGWQLANVRVLPAPLPCRGMQGLWPVPDDIADALRRMGLINGAPEVSRG